MPTIMPNVRRSRRICTNSLTTMAQNRDGENSGRFMMASTLLKKGSDPEEEKGSDPFFTDFDIRPWLFHEMDKDIFQPGFDVPPFVGLRAKRRDRMGEVGVAVAADVQRAAECDRLLDAGLVPQLVREFEQLRPADRPGRQVGVFDHLLGRTVGEQL